MIKDSPTKVIDDVGQEYDPTEIPKATLTKEDQEMVDTQDVVKYMARTYPEMTGEFLKIQSEQYGDTNLYKITATLTASLIIHSIIIKWIKFYLIRL